MYQQSHILSPKTERMKKFNLFIGLCLLLFLCSECKKEEENKDTETPKTFASIGNSWDVNINGINSLSAEVVSVEESVYTLNISFGKLSSQELKFGYNGKEVVDYVYGRGDNSKSFIMVKFDAELGDKYAATINGIYHEREVVELQKYHIPALGKDLHTIGVYEWIPYEIPSQYFGYTVREIMWYWHESYGLVCVDFWTEEGEFIEVHFVDIPD